LNKDFQYSIIQNADTVQPMAMKC